MYIIYKDFVIKISEGGIKMWVQKEEMQKIISVNLEVKSLFCCEFVLIVIVIFRVKLILVILF